MLDCIFYNNYTIDIIAFELQLIYPMSQVRISMYNGGMEVMFAIFMATGSSRNTWLSPQTCVKSSYTDIQDNGMYMGNPYQVFSVIGLVSPRYIPKCGT